MSHFGHLGWAGGGGGDGLEVELGDATVSLFSSSVELSSFPESLFTGETIKRNVQIFVKTNLTKKYQISKKATYTSLSHICTFWLLDDIRHENLEN